ncbi:hypothetical protein K491DRAFT_687041 [Lophiostoma macrostomum CBS 122681]|uniref:PPPDE domain-containing protein n=1 Tax=Lophiostoma macrostomum CBS 122681 TaxID=1314788 RepID=A0A6A6TQI4_9PLEO|nr:hypothetical protein K491DRAFT_687041 [Lophiostoma macrostomum CBS 122681]
MYLFQGPTVSAEAPDDEAWRCIQHALSQAQRDLSLDASHVLIEYMEAYRWDEVSGDANHPSTLKESGYRISTRVSEFKHASLIALKPNNDGTGYEGHCWDLGTEGTTKVARLRQPLPEWEYRRTSHFQAVGLTIMSPEEITEIADEFIRAHPSYQLLSNNCENFSKAIAGRICEPASMVEYQEMLRSRLQGALGGIPGLKKFVEEADPLAASWTFMAKFRGLGTIAMPAVLIPAFGIFCLLARPNLAREIGGL